MMRSERDPALTPGGKLVWTQRLPAPAKINLFLHVVGRREDGYHLLQTVFRFLDHGDWLRFFPREDGQIKALNPIQGVPPERDLCLRAARLLREAAGPGFAHCGVEIELIKHLPMGGGLGGGSSDAATVLWALNTLWGIHFSREKLQALGLSLGADVPVFLFGRAAFAEGVGERLRPIELPPAWYLVVEPPAQVSTQEVFASLRLTQPSKIIRMPDFSEGLPLEKRGLCNDLQPGVMKMSPVVAEAMEFLSKLGPARMSGSGACVFAEFRDQHSALKALSQWQKTAGVTTGVTSAMGRAWVAKGLDVHPLSGSPGG